MLALPPVIGVPAAFVSHHFIDRWPEHYIEEALIAESGMHGIDIIAGLATNNLQQVIAGIILGNAMDGIDKLVAPALGVTANTVFECHHTGYAEKLPAMSKHDTIKANAAATVATVLTLMLE